MAQTSKPIISICIPTYNGEKFLQEALISIKNQTYQNIEVVISDDNSEDSSIQLIKAFQKSVKFPVYIHHHIPNGIGANWNNCVKKARGEYIKFLFQDDVLYPNCITELVAIAEKDKEIGLVFSDREIINAKGQKVHWGAYTNLASAWEKLEEIQWGRELLKQSNFLNEPNNKIGEPSIVLIKRECFDEVGYFSEKLKQSLDYEYWYRVMSHFKVGYVNQKLSAFRLHAEQATSINASSDSGWFEKLNYLKSLWKHISKYLSNGNRIKLYFLIWKFELISVFKKAPQ